MYIGIGKKLDRIFEGHNDQAEKLRDSKETGILQTAEPFSTREDALMAEAIAIHVASFFISAINESVGKNNQIELLDDYSAEVGKLDEEKAQKFELTNRQGVKSSKLLIPAIQRKSGDVEPNNNDLKNTLIVPISLKDIHGLPSSYGALKGDEFAPRATCHWAVAKKKRPYIRHLLAVLRDSKIILGSWKVDPDSEWTLIPRNEIPKDKTKDKYEKRVKIPVTNPAEDDYYKMKGKTWKGTLNQGVGYADTWVGPK